MDQELLKDKFRVVQLDAEWAEQRTLVLSRGVLLRNYPLLKHLLEASDLDEVRWTVGAYSVSIQRQW